MKALNRAINIHKRLERKGTTHQVRFWHGWFLMYPFPCKRGYGVRGEFVGVYNSDTPVDWILEDIVLVLSDS